jgi:hypothetical protein
MVNADLESPYGKDAADEGHTGKKETFPLLKTNKISTKLDTHCHSHQNVDSVSMHNKGPPGVWFKLQ